MSPEQKPPATPPVRSLEEDIEAISVEGIADRVADPLEDRDPLHAHASWFSGPVPSPGHMKEYAEIDPSFPDRFFAMAEKQQAHDQAVEKDIIATNTKIVSEYQVLEKRGQTLGLYSRGGWAYCRGGNVRPRCPSGWGHNRDWQPSCPGRSLCLWSTEECRFLTTPVSCHRGTPSPKR